MIKVETLTHYVDAPAKGEQSNTPRGPAERATTRRERPQTGTSASRHSKTACR